MPRAIDEIIECFDDKVAMKNINIETMFTGFDEDLETGYLIKSDQTILDQATTN